MPQEPLELILTRQWASYLATPVWVLSANQTLVYCNEPAEELFGLDFDEAGPYQLGVLAEMFEVSAADDSDSLPIMAAMRERKVTHHFIRWRNLNGIWMTGEVTAFPLLGTLERLLGVVALFSEIKRD